MLLNKLNDDCFIFTIPGKFPEAYHETIDELTRRKAYNIALERLCTIFKRALKAERKAREGFNRKYGEYLPISIQGDLQQQTIDIIFSNQEVALSKEYNFIDQIEISKDLIVEKFVDIFNKLFSDIKVNFKELISVKQPKIEERQKEDK